MNAKRSPLTNQSVQHQRRCLADLVVFGEELLELVDQKQQPRHRPAGVCVAETADVLHSVIAEQVASLFEDFIQPLQNAEAEFAVAFDRDDTSVRQLVCGIGLKFDTLLEVDQVELDFVRAVVEREIRHQDVHEGRFARAGFARDHDVLRSASTEPHVLQFRRAGSTERHVDSVSRIVLPKSLRHDSFERDFDSSSVLRFVADALDDARELVRLGRGFGGERQPSQGCIDELQVAVAECEAG